MILRQFLHTDPVAASYVFGCGGKAIGAVVDPLGKIAPYLRTSEETGMRIRYVVDTHLHADHVSAGRELAETAGAEYVLFAGANVNFPFHKVRDGDVLELGRSRYCTLPAILPSTSRSWSAITRVPRNLGLF